MTHHEEEDPHAHRMTTCPECGVSVATHNLDAHHAKAHPTARDRAAGAVSRNWKAMAFAAVLVAAIVVVGYLAVRPTGADGTLAEEWIGRPAPDFSLPDAVDGSMFTLNDPAEPGWTLLLLNEGLGCAPCYQQTADLGKDHARFHELGVRMASIQPNSLSSLRQWTRDAGVSNIAVLSDPDLRVEEAYETTGADVSMMPGMTAGHTFVLVDPDGIVQWRADYGPGVMYVDQDEVYDAVRSAMGK